MSYVGTYIAHPTALNHSMINW